MADSSTLAQIASVIAGFGAAMLFFRIQREIQMAQGDERIWIPAADWLLILAVFLSLLLVIVPLLLTSSDPPIITNLARAGCVAATIMLGGYILGILAHYRLIFGRARKGPRDNPEPAEKALVILTVVVAVAAFIIVILGIL